MAHYAFLDENEIVIEVIAGKDETELIDGLTPEEWYGNFRNKKCVRTSYNSNIRGTFAGIGYFYDKENDIFVAPKPFNSWIQNGSFWAAPIEYPQDGLNYYWNESEGNWNVIS